MSIQKKQRTASKLRKLFRKHGGPVKVGEAISKFTDKPVTGNVVNQWVQRGAVPAYMVIPLALATGEKLHDLDSKLYPKDMSEAWEPRL